MDKEIYKILSSLNKIKSLDCIDSKMYHSFYTFFIENYKNYDTFDSLILSYLICNENELNDSLDFFNKFIELDIKINKQFIINEINRRNYIMNYDFYSQFNNEKIIKFNDYKNYFNKNKKKCFKIGYFSIYSKWFDNYIIIKDLYSGNILKVYVDNNILDKIFNNDILKLEIYKKEKAFWNVFKVLEFYPNRLNTHIYDRIKKL